MLRIIILAVAVTLSSILINVDSKTTKPIKPSKADDMKHLNNDAKKNLKLGNEKMDTTIAESSTIHSVNVTERAILPTFPYPLGTLDPETNNKTADLIKMINNIDVKHIVPLVIASGPKKESHPVLRNRKSFRRRRPYNKIYKMQSRPPDLRIRPKSRLINRVRDGKPYGLKSHSQAPLPVGLINKDHGKYVLRTDDRDSLVFMLQPGLQVNDDQIIRTHAIKNPEVIENYMNRRRRSHHKKRKKKPRSTSSESSDSMLDFRTNNRRMGYPADRDYGQLAMRAESGEGEGENINYDEKSDDYIITTKKGVWDYEHENWAVVTKKYDWSKESNESSEGNDGNDRDKQSSDNERMNILKHIDEEHKRFELQKHKHWGESDAAAKVETILKDKGVGKEHMKDRNEWASKNEYKESNNIKSDSEIKKIKQYNSNEKENENWQRNENEEKPPDYSSKHYRDQAKRNHKDRNKTGSHHFEDKSRDEERQHEGRHDRSDVEEKSGKIDRVVGIFMDKKTQQHKGDRKESYNNKRYDSDSREVHKEDHKHQDDYGEKTRYRDERPKRDETNDKSKEISRHRDRDRRQSTERTGLRSRENVDDFEKKRHKKSQLRHIETVNKDWGTAKMVDWGHHRSQEDLRSNKRGWGHHRIKEEDVSRNNERYKFDAKQSQTQKKVDKKNDKKKIGDYENFWNRHAHNEWDKVGVNWGVNKKEHKVYKERVPVVIKTTASKDIWDRHGNNDWDKVGRYEDYKDRVSYDIRPQSHRSQNSGDPVYFGYVHTSLPFKGKKTIFDKK